VDYGKGGDRPWQPFINVDQDWRRSNRAILGDKFDNLIGKWKGV
jgi:hypothetical protein